MRKGKPTLHNSQHLSVNLGLLRTVTDAHSKEHVDVAHLQDNALPHNTHMLHKRSRSLLLHAFLADSNSLQTLLANI